MLARTRALITLTLAIATAGVAIPYGTATGPTTTFDLNAVEWALSALAAVAAIGLVLDLADAHPFGRYVHDHGIAFMVAGFVWAALAAYNPPGATIWWILGHTLPELAWAILALTTWRLVVIDRTNAADAARAS